jgi:hypothetical protein
MSHNRIGPWLFLYENFGTFQMLQHTQVLVTQHRGEARREGCRGRLHCAGDRLIINSNLSLILKKSSGSTDPDAKPQLRP